MINVGKGRIGIVISKVLAALLMLANKVND